MTPKAKPLICPSCGSKVSRVIDVREEPRLRAEQLRWTGSGLWRKRRCEACGFVFETEEHIIPTPIPPAA